MRFTCIILCYLLFTTTIFSQEKEITGGVTYSIFKSIKVNTDTISDHSAKKFLKSILNDDKDNLPEATLSFNSNTSYFKHNKKLGMDNNKIDILSLMLKSRGSIFSNSEDKSTYSKSTKDGSFLIKDEWVDLEWELTKESKIIAGYKCYKAKGQKKVFRRSKDKYKIVNVYAWYSPEISASFGPHIYGGLPGLILELIEENLMTYVVKQITLNNKTEIKLKPNKKIITRLQYNKLQRESYLNK